MNPEHDSFLKQTRQQLDDSADSLDAATLSRLNQARQKALQHHRQSRFMPFKLPVAGAFASIGMALLAAWIWTSQPQQAPVLQMAADTDDMPLLISDTDLELLEQLDFMSWLVIEQATEQEAKNAG